MVYCLGGTMVTISKPWATGCLMPTLSNKELGAVDIVLTNSNAPGAASFFTAPSEEDASAVLKAIDPRPDKVGARYIMSDAIMATDIFMAMPEWTLGHK